jgi:hypothetical protein
MASTVAKRLMSAVWRPIKARRNESDFAVGLLIVVLLVAVFDSVRQYDECTGRLRTFTLGDPVAALVRLSLKLAHSTSLYSRIIEMAEVPWNYPLCIPIHYFLLPAIFPLSLARRLPVPDRKCAGASLHCHSRPRQGCRVRARRSPHATAERPRRSRPRLRSVVVLLLQAYWADRC